MRAGDIVHGLAGGPPEGRRVKCWFPGGSSEPVLTEADLDLMAHVQTNIMGNCLCVLGDSMAMPVGSMIEKFRDEFEEHIEAARRRNGGLPLAAHGGRADLAVGSSAP